MDHLAEVMKIVSGAASLNLKQVTAYTELLAAKLEEEGDSGAAERLRRVLASKSSRRIALARFRTEPGIPVDPESRLGLADELTPAETRERLVVLNPEIRPTIEEFISYVKAADRLLAHGVGISPSLLLYGPSGCGKSVLAEWLSGSLDLPLVIGRIDSLISSYLGRTAKNLRLLFDHAVSRPCVLFLDEFDAVAKLRDDRHELGELKRVVVSLLQNIDWLGAKTVLIAATNHEHLLDAAVWRRFHYKVHITSPGKVARQELFRAFLGSRILDKTLNIAVSASEGMSGAEIEQVSKNCVRKSIIAGIERVGEIDILGRILEIKNPEALDDSAPLAARLKSLRDSAPGIFTYRRLSRLLGVSTGRISGILGAASG